MFIPEKDPGKSTSHVPSMLKDVPNIMTMRELPDRKFGVPKTDMNTIEMKQMFEQRLINETVVFSEAFCSRIRDADGYKSTKTGIFEQIEGYTRKLEPSKTNPEGPPKVIFTGKIGGKQDDCMVTLEMLDYWRQSYLEQSYTYPPYMRFRESTIQRKKQLLGQV